jgi:hypothetical protein
MLRKFILVVLLFSNCFFLSAQLKYLIEDFEGLAQGNSDFKANGLFTYGNVSAETTMHKDSLTLGYAGRRCLEITRSVQAGKGKNAVTYGGWGKGVGMFVELDVLKDYISFYIHCQAIPPGDSLKIELQEDDNASGMFEKTMDDSWICAVPLNTGKDGWQLISIPLASFRDANYAGDGNFNVGYRKGKLFCFIVSFISSSSTKKSGKQQRILFDFICLSEGKLKTGRKLFDPPRADNSDYCNLGAWSKEGNTANFSEIAHAFEDNFDKSEKKLGIVHFFQPFAVDGGTTQNFYPSKERINDVISKGYIPMITLENHFVNLSPNKKQPNLYSIVEGHFDSFFVDWAKQVKDVDGTVLLRILHEFNGDWYPWCVVNNDQNPELFIQAFRHIHDIFNEQKVNNVKFIWCPNSMSLPQESWNYIMDAYPGDDYVDFVGLDIYNGAGKSLVWRSFRKEGIEVYYTVTKLLKDKPIIICETASRERGAAEPRNAQDKGEWIEQMADALQTDMSQFRLLTWFNEKETFRINSSNSSRNAFVKYIVNCSYFKSGTKNISSLIRK